MSHVLKHNVADQIAYFRAYDTDGTAKTDLDSSTTGLTLSVFRVGASSVSIASLSDKAADDSTHADGAIRNVGGNLYTVDLPDAATATQVPSVVVRGSYTGGVIEGLEHPIVAYNPATNYASATQATDIEADTQNIQSRLPTSLTGGLMQAYVVGASNSGADTISSRIATNIVDGSYSWPAALGEIADAVYDEPYAGHTTPGTYGFLWDKWRKSNPTITGEVTAAVTPTTTTFSTDITGYADTAFDNAVLVFINGSTNADFRGVVSGYLQANGQVTITPALPQAPVAGDEFVIAITSFVYTTAQTQNGLATSAEVAAIDAVTDKLDTTLELDGGVYRFTANALEEAPTGGGGGGTGSFTINLVVKLGNGNTVGDCDVSLTTSSTSSTTNLIASARTNPNGEVTFQLDSGVYYVWRQKLGVNFDNPAVLTVAGDGSATVS